MYVACEHMTDMARPQAYSQHAYLWDDTVYEFTKNKNFI